MPDIRLLTASPPVSEPLPPIKPLRRGREWNIKASPCVSASRNTIRSTLAEIMAIQPATSKPVINLGLGDPTTLHTPPPASVTAVVDTLQNGRDNGYIPGPGTVAAREAIGRYHKRWDGVTYGVNDIILTHGVGHALDTIFSLLVTPHPFDSFEPRTRCNVLIPRPGFAQYGMLLNSLGAEIRFYSLKEEQNWEVDVEELNMLCDENTKAILLTNPSNPCGSNFSKNHLLDILDVADRHKVPIISDEIYGHLTWNAPFVPLAALSDSVPIITLSGLSKRFLLPGWRIGWLALHDPLGVAGEIQQGMVTWSNRFMGPSSIVQASLGAILETPDEWHKTCLERVKLNADILSTAIAQIPGLSCQKPQGALYILVKLQEDVLGSTNDVDFCKALYRDQGLFLMPGSCFDAPGYVRLVIASPADVTREVAVRLRDFCMRSTQRA